MAKGFIPGLVEETKGLVEEQGKIAREAEMLQSQKELQKKKIQEKQIRALRNTFRPAGGFLQAGGRGVGLGESTGLPTKLGMG